MDKVVRVYESFEEAEKADRAYYRGLTPQLRLKLLFELVATHEGGEDAPQERLQRVCRVTERRGR